MRNLLLATALMLTACVDAGPDGSPGPDAAERDAGIASAQAVKQCRDLVGTFCLAADECGFDVAAGTCLDYYGAMCDANQTIVTPSTMTSAHADLSVYECAANEAWIIFPDPSGQAILDAMLVWDARDAR